MFAPIAISAAIKASRILLEYFKRLATLTVQHKADRTRVSEADLTAHRILNAALENTGIPVISEEAAAPGNIGSDYWLIDPLDGTDEFLSGNPEFCVCIALISRGAPVFGILAWPVERKLFVSENKAVHELDFEANVVRVWAPPVSSDIRNVLVSRTRPDPSVAALLEATPAWRSVTRGSALKCVDLITGEADVYPRNAALSAWDLAAGDALLRALGGGLYHHQTGELLQYHAKETKLQPFVGAASRDKALAYFLRKKELAL
jgi:3'(2'), 5'-bisphosphate nucleotidase